ncbi:MAG: carboxymuconolactone decarboxylase family protein [Acidimicrobiaceae bacterium]|nr:carboxymuconolactone decarboxylase family protein [Acidimicrobiaceae bacterium]MXW75092.1 carboxymuconolactone decarboxylase family protein [Acidimicrobiaceae bacterium]MYA74183.1 carboxymuconolactone decarboxylase family protein [Acidimicrobiaceae bacterium]MYC42477.1 carboxymuconolactone decarboxylase family protein [Acidimicrobiaceae bacterium]MYD07615.1 carboxymuconolactone decarboxylase family protein [Acidimicrobiaceae bacterium]
MLERLLPAFGTTVASVPKSPEDPHIPPLPVQQWRDDLVEAFSVMKPPPDSVYATRRANRESGGKRVAGAFAVLAHHPDLTRAFLSFNRHVLYHNTLGERLLELVVMRVALLRGSEYEWAEHAAVARELGFSEEQIDAVAIGPSAEGLSTIEALLLRAVDELRHDSVFSADTWSRLTEHLDTRQIIDLLFTVGAYDTLAVAFNCFGLEVDPDLQDSALP